MTDFKINDLTKEELEKQIKYLRSATPSWYPGILPIKICARHAPRLHHPEWWEMFERQHPIHCNKHNNEYIFLGCQTSYENVLKWINWHTDRGLEIKHHNPNEGIILKSAGGKTYALSW